MTKHKVVLNEEQRADLEELVLQVGSQDKRTVINALILLKCDEGRNQSLPLSCEDVAQLLSVSRRKVNRVKKRFIEAGLDTALNGRKCRENSNIKFPEEMEEQILELTRSRPPEGHSKWSLRLLADRVVELGYCERISYQTVRRILKKYGFDNLDFSNQAEPES